MYASLDLSGAVNGSMQTRCIHWHTESPLEKNFTDAVNIPNTSRKLPEHFPYSFNDKSFGKFSGRFSGRSSGRFSTRRNEAPKNRHRQFSKGFLSRVDFHSGSRSLAAEKNLLTIR